MTESRRPVSQGAEELLGRYFPVLDHGFVALVDYMGTDACIERAARVSYGYGTRRTSATRGLLRYLRRHRHTTPSEMVELKFHCSMPIFVARQWIRHRTASVNEYSGRYSLMPLLFYLPNATDVRSQSEANRQGRSGSQVSEEVYQEATRRWNAAREQNAAAYRFLTEHEVAREIARIDLPLSTYTQWYWKIDLHNLLRFLTLRVDPHAQWEIRQYAEVMAGMLQMVAPISFEAWVDYDLLGASLSRMELDLVRLLLKVEEGRLVPTGEPGLPLAKSGLSRRECDEMETLLASRPTPEFPLRMEDSLTAEEIEAKTKAAALELESAPPYALD